MDLQELSATAKAVLNNTRLGRSSRWIAMELKLNRTTVRRHMLTLRLWGLLDERAV